MKRRLGKIVGLFVVTLFALAVMYVSGGRNDFGAQQKEVDPENSIVDVLAPVTVMPLKQQHIEIIDSYAGTILPLESFSLAFQLAGQVESLGTNEEGRPLDIGDRVKTGQVLATLDTRILIARREEANANLENAQTEFQRLVNLREKSPGAVTQTAFQQATQAQSVAKALKDIAEKNLENAQLIAPADGVISSRMINPGETINPQQTVFELVQVDKVLLTVGVPESRIVAMQKQFNATRRVSQANPQSGTPDPTSHFKVYIRRFDTSSNLEKDTILEGTVYRIAETVDNRNGLFEVDVLLDNANRLLKPGIVAKADFVVREIDGYKVPVESVVFNDRVASLFFAQPATDHPTSSVDFVGMDVAEVPNFVAHRIEIPSYIEQGRNFVLTDLPGKHDLLIVQGQHRLVEGRPLEIMSGTTSVGTSDASSLSEIPPMADVSQLGRKPTGK